MLWCASTLAKSSCCKGLSEADFFCVTFYSVVEFSLIFKLFLFGVNSKHPIFTSIQVDLAVELLEDLLGVIQVSLSVM